MRMMRGLLGRLNNRGTIMSLVALGTGAAVFGFSRRRMMNGNAWRQMVQPVRRMF